jgi:hypothetical protein
MKMTVSTFVRLKRKSRKSIVSNAKKSNVREKRLALKKKTESKLWKNTSVMTMSSRNSKPRTR